MAHKGHYGEYTGNARHSRKTNIWEEEDVKRGRREERKGHYGHAEALFDDAHDSYNWRPGMHTHAEHGTSRRSSSPLNDEGHGGAPGHGHATMTRYIAKKKPVELNTAETISEDKLDFSGSTSMHEGEKPIELVGQPMPDVPYEEISDMEEFGDDQPDYEDPLYKPKDTTGFMEKKSAFDNKGKKKFGK